MIHEKMGGSGHAHSENISYWQCINVCVFDISMPMQVSIVVSWIHEKYLGNTWEVDITHFPQVNFENKSFF